MGVAILTEAWQGRTHRASRARLSKMALVATAKIPIMGVSFWETEGRWRAMKVRATSNEIDDIVGPILHRCERNSPMCCCLQHVGMSTCSESLFLSHRLVLLACRPTLYGKPAGPFLRLPSKALAKKVSRGANSRITPIIPVYVTLWLGIVV